MSERFAETAEQLQKFNKVLADYKKQPGSLMMIMQKAQDIYGYLPIEVQTRIAEALNVPLQEVYGIATFYTQFNIVPAGKHKVSVCLGTACYVRGSGEILEKFKDKLGIAPGQTTPDGNFTLEASRCIGCCGLAPVLTVDKKVYGNVKVSDVEKILSSY